MAKGTGAKRTSQDSWITAKTKIGLFADARVKGRQIEVETHQGKIVLRGKVDTDEAKMAAEDIAKVIEGTKDVKNDCRSSSHRSAWTSTSRMVRSRFASRTT
jgi:osmotically-inducible protein OsmY